jgi:hypothetical protein
MNDDLDVGIPNTPTRNAVYNDPAYSSELLKTVTTRTSLQISQSNIPGAGVGLFTTQDIEDGEEIFKSEPLVNCVQDGMQKLVCDNCYTCSESRLHPTGRFLTADDPKPTMNACSGCKVCYYCSRVSTSPRPVFLTSYATGPVSF